MDIKQAVGIRLADIDTETGERLPHSEVYGRIIDHLGGVYVVSKLVPFSKEEIADALSKGDEHLNSLSLRKWEWAAGFNYKSAASSNGFVGGPFWRLLAQHGINCASSAECVCVLKECARRMVC